MLLSLQVSACCAHSVQCNSMTVVWHMADDNDFITAVDHPVSDDGEFVTAVDLPLLDFSGVVPPLPHVVQAPAAPTEWPPSWADRATSENASSYRPRLWASDRRDETVTSGHHHKQRAWWIGALIAVWAALAIVDLVLFHSAPR